MNANRIIDMIVRQVMRRIVKSGVDKGFEWASRATDARAHSNQDQASNASRNGPHNLKRQKQVMRQTQRLSRNARRFMKF